MRMARAWLWQIHRCERGATMAEYVVMTMFIAAVVFFGAQALGSGLLDRFNILAPLWGG